jgi:hypothetical protein
VTGEARDVALIAIVAIAPLALVLVIALLKGYRIELLMRRDRKDREDGDR